MCLVYLADIIDFSKSIEKHMEYVNKILQRLKEAGVTFEIKKCEFFTDTVEYFGHIIKPGKLEIGHALTAYLKNSFSPANESESSARTL